MTTRTRQLLAATAIAAAAIITTTAPADARTNCTTSTVYTWGTKYPTCNLHPPQQLNVLAITRTTCLHWGGTWGGSIKLRSGQITTICYDVDY